MLLADGASAQANACDQLKGVLAARIEASGVRGHSLEAVPAGTPVPPDASAIGTCEAGKYKILYRRWGAARLSSSGASAGAAASAARPASAARAIAVPDAPTRQSPDVQRDRALPPVAASMPSPAPLVVVRSTAAASALLVLREPEKPLSRSASQAEAVRVIDRAAVAPPAQAQAAQAVEVKVPLARQASELMGENWRWIWVLIFLPVAAWVWGWYTHRRDFDETGLPRGPRL